MPAYPRASITPDQLPGIHLTTGVLLGLTAPSTGLLLLLAIGLFLPGLRLSSHRTPLLTGILLGQGRQWARSEEETPLSWDRPKRASLPVLAEVRASIRSQLACLQESSRELAAALVLGDRLSRPRQARFARAGVQHLAAQSGLHIGICFGLALWLLPNRIESEIAAWSLALAYALLAGARPSALRAVLLLALHLGVRRRGLASHGLGLLSLAALIFLLVDPECLESVGALLSFSATYGILHLGPGFRSCLAPRLPAWLASPLAASLGATLGSLGVTLASFGQIPVLGALVNLIAIPLGTILVPLAFLCTLAAIASPTLASGIDTVLFAPVTWILDQVATLAAHHLPVLEVPPLPSWSVALLAVLVHHLGCLLRPLPENEKSPCLQGPSRLSTNQTSSPKGSEDCQAASSSDS